MKKQTPGTTALPDIGFKTMDDYARARDVLLGSGYTDRAMLEMVGGPLESLPLNGAAKLALGRSTEGSPLETLIRLFLIGEPVEADRATRALKPMPLERWTDAGVVALDGDSVRGLVRLAPFRGLWLVYDLPLEKLRPDYVMGVGTSTVMLMDLAIRRPVRTMLDLGSGCGTLGLFAARHCERVIATDDNPRAVQLTRFNSSINGLTNVQAERGDLFEPVAGRKFDLILSNPPFVISPDSSYLYRDGGMGSDGFCQRLIREVPAVMSEGGFCQILCNWAHHRGEDWKKRIECWFEGSGCDVWVMRRETEETATYANTWISQTESDEPGVFTEVYKRWMEYYDAQGIERISTGLITMRRDSKSSNWLHIDEIPPQIIGPCGDDIALRFALRDFLEMAPYDDMLMEMKPIIMPTVRLHQSMRPKDEGWETDGLELHRERGLAAAAKIDPYVAELVSRCNGQRTLGQLIDDLARTMGQDRTTVAGPMLQIVRQLIEQAFIVPEDLGH